MRKILVSLNEPLVEELDKYCVEHCYDRSEVIRTLLREKFLRTTGARKYTDILNEDLAHKEKEIEKVKEKTNRIAKTPVGKTKLNDKLGGKSIYDMCSKHSSMFTTCGCEPK